jgi:hypothetical protein
MAHTQSRWVRGQTHSRGHVPTDPENNNPWLVADGTPSQVCRLGPCPWRIIVTDCEWSPRGSIRCLPDTQQRLSSFSANRKAQCGRGTSRSMRHAAPPVAKSLLPSAMTLLATEGRLVLLASPARANRIAELSAMAAAVALSPIVPRADAPWAITLEASDLDEVDRGGARHPQRRGRCVDLRGRPCQRPRAPASPGGQPSAGPLRVDAVGSGGRDHQEPSGCRARHAAARRPPPRCARDCA